MYSYLLYDHASVYITSLNKGHLKNKLLSIVYKFNESRSILSAIH